MPVGWPEQGRFCVAELASLFAKLGHRSVIDRAASGGNGEQACFAEVAGVAEVLAGGPIRGDLQAHLVVARWRSGHRGPRRVAAADEWPSRLAAAVGAVHRQLSATAGPYLNRVDAQAFRRRRTRRRGPPPRRRTDRRP